MNRCYGVLTFFFLALLGVGAFDHAGSQDFPYLAPAAPEFDNSGHQTRGPAKSNNEQTIGPKITPLTPEAIRNFGFAPPSQDHADQDSSKPPSTKHSAPSNTQSRPSVRQDTSKPTPGPGQNRGPAQQPRRVDCSQYPAMIANARSEAEMQITARYYLTCLLQDGWPMENARAQVIQTIEAVMRANR